MIPIRYIYPYPIFLSALQSLVPNRNIRPDERYTCNFVQHFIPDPDTRNKGRGGSWDTYHLHGKTGEIRVENHVSCHYVREVSEKNGRSFEAVHFFSTSQVI